MSFNEERRNKKDFKRINIGKVKYKKRILCHTPSVILCKGTIVSENESTLIQKIILDTLCFGVFSFDTFLKQLAHFFKLGSFHLSLEVNLSSPIKIISVVIIAFMAT